MAANEITGNEFTDIALRCFAKANGFHKKSSYVLKYVLQWRFGIYMTDADFVKLMQSAGFDTKPIKGRNGSALVRCRVIPDKGVQRALWNYGRYWTKRGY